MRLLLVICIFSLLSGASLHADELVFRDDFKNLENWKPLAFEKVPRRSQYEIVHAPDDGPMLKLESEGGASALISRRTFSVREAGRISWSWKVERFPPPADPVTKRGDDYPLRVYLIFQYNPDNASFLKHMKYRTYKSLYGEYPPDSSLNYVWSGVNLIEKSFDSPYTSLSRIIVLRSGKKNSEVWRNEEVDVLSDYLEQFGNEPPEMFKLGIMTDSDNTGGRTRAFLRSLDVWSKFRKAENSSARREK